MPRLWSGWAWHDGAWRLLCRAADPIACGQELVALGQQQGYRLRDLWVEPHLEPPCQRPRAPAERPAG
jgi:hypothetical protein